MELKHRIQSFVSAIILLFLFSGCTRHIESPVIAISKVSDNYINWLTKADSTVRYFNMYTLPVDSALSMLNQCNGLLVTGGPDVYPGIYGDENETARCGTIDHFRDSLEISLIKRALELGMPVFGVCRGEQILNVVYGGTLFIDIPDDYDTTVIHRCENYLNCFHMVYVEPNSLLHTICNCDSALVTTNHHQAVRTLGAGLKANVRSVDGLIEGVEPAEPDRSSFLIAVQWHPERMELQNPLSGPLVREFLSRCKEFSAR